MLLNGRILITGGKGANGVLASAEIFGIDGSFHPANSMYTARRGHSAVLLKDGRVLVAGGETIGEGQPIAQKSITPPPIPGASWVPWSRPAPAIPPSFSKMAVF